KQQYPCLHRGHKAHRPAGALPWKKSERLINFKIRKLHLSTKEIESPFSCHKLTDFNCPPPQLTVVWIASRMVIKNPLSEVTFDSNNKPVFVEKLVKHKRYLSGDVCDVGLNENMHMSNIHHARSGAVLRGQLMNVPRIINYISCKFGSNFMHLHLIRIP
ncbi:hypothetical protein L9F63_009795, partial [Diploptera punctata]